MHALGRPGAGVDGGEGGLRVEERVVGSFGVAAFGGAVAGTVTVGGVEEDLPGALGVRVEEAVAAEGVVVCPGREVDGVLCQAISV